MIILACPMIFPSKSLNCCKILDKLYQHFPKYSVFGTSQPFVRRMVSSAPHKSSGDVARNSGPNTHIHTPVSTHRTTETHHILLYCNNINTNLTSLDLGGHSPAKTDVGLIYIYIYIYIDICLQYTYVVYLL